MKEENEEEKYSIAYNNGYNDAIEDFNMDWVDIRFRIPEINEPVLVFVPDSDFKIGIDEYMHYSEPFKAFRYAGVTHWRNLPKEPILKSE